MMDLIILNNDLYSFYELCDLLRLKLTTYHSEINVHSMNDGSGQWFGCISK